LKVNARTDRAAATDTLLLELNSDTGTNYNFQVLNGASSTATALRRSARSDWQVGQVSAASATSGVFSGGEFLIPDAFSTRSHSSLIALSGAAEDIVYLMAGRWANTAAITSVTFKATTGDFVSGSTFELAVVDEMYAIAGAEQILTADGTFTVEGLPQLAGDVVLIGNLRCAEATTERIAKLSFNDDETDANYARQRLRGVSTTASATASSDRFIMPIGADSLDASAFSPLAVTISNHAEGVNDPSVLAIGGYHGSSSQSKVQVNSSRRNNVEAVTKLNLAPNGSPGTFLTNSMLSAYHVPKNVIAQEKLEADAASVTLTIPQGYEHFKLSVYARTDQATTEGGLDVEFNGDTTASRYDVQRLIGTSSSVLADQFANVPRVMVLPGASIASNVFGGGSMTVQNYTKTDRHKHRLATSGNPGTNLYLTSGRWESTAAITSMRVFPPSGNFVAGSIFTVEGIGKDSIGWEDQGVARGGITGNGYKVEVDWANTGAMVALSDITADVTGLTWESGRDIASQLAGRATAGKATISLRNNSDQYNRNNSSGAYFGNILPGRKVRITDTTTGQIQFSGFMVNPATMVTMPRHKVARMTAYGIIAELARPDINIAKQSSITTGALIDAVLDQAGLTSSDHDIDAGQTTVTKYFKSDKQKALGAIREFEFTEAGFIRENHHLDGILSFEDRHHRLKPPNQDSQAIFGDSGTAGEYGFDQIQPSDDMALIYNEFVARVELYTTQSIATLWTHAEANTSGTAPSIAPGESYVSWANYPNPATVPEGKYVDAWTTPVATTDYTSNTQTGGGGTDRTGTTSIAVSKLSNAMKITLTNDHATDTIFITSLKARGTAVFADDPVVVREEDTTSQTAYTRSMPKTWERRAEAKWVPSSSEALDWAKYHLGIYKDPSPTVVMGYKANRDLYTSHEASIRQVSDRISLDLTGASGTGLDIDEDFFVEKVRHHVNLNGVHRVTYWLSSTAGFSDYWVLGKSLLGTETRIAY
jgi:hypothetical protein